MPADDFGTLAAEPHRGGARSAAQRGKGRAIAAMLLLAIVNALLLTLGFVAAFDSCVYHGGVTWAGFFATLPWMLFAEAIRFPLAMEIRYYREGRY